jgi:dephospho-CoA kinase
MLKVGITGGIGSGKTTVCRMFEVLGVPVYYADDRAKALMQNDVSIKAKLTDLFGAEVYTETGQLNRKFIADSAFTNPKVLAQLNAIVHPAVFNDSQQWFASHENKPYTLYEAAILFETGSYLFMDKTIVVFAPLEDRIERTMKRDNVSREEVMERVSKQMPEEEKMAKADYVIYNNHTQPLIEQVLTIHHRLIELSKQNFII